MTRIGWRLAQGWEGFDQYVPDRKLVYPMALRGLTGEAQEEARLHAHGWGIGALAMVYTQTDKTRFLDEARQAMHWCLGALRKPNGALRFQSDHEDEYPRSEGHFFCGAAELLSVLAP